MKRKRHSPEHFFLDRLHVLSLDHIGPKRTVRMKEPLDVLAIILPRRLAPLKFLGSQEQLCDLDHRHGPVGQRGGMFAVLASRQSAQSLMLAR